MTGPGGRGDGRVVWSAVGVITTGVLGWVAMVVVARAEGPARFAAFAVVWAVFFGIGGAFAGLQQEVTRTVSRADEAGAGPTRLLGPVVVLTVPSALLVVLLVLVDGGALGASSVELGAALGVGLLGLGVLTFLAGGLAARDAWPSLALLMSADATVRTGGVVACVAWDRPDLLPWAIALGAFAWAPLLAVPSVWRALGAHGHDSIPGLVRRSLTAMGSAGCAALMVTGFPLLLWIARRDDLTPEVGVLLATLILVRAPLLVVLYGFRPVVMRGFLAPGARVRSAVWRWWGILAGGGVVGVALAALAGPAVVRRIFGEGYSTRPSELATLAAGSVLLGMLVVSGIALVAVDRHLASAAGWLTSVVATVAVLAVPDSSVDALLLAVIAGPVVGLAITALALRGVPAPAATS